MALQPLVVELLKGHVVMQSEHALVNTLYAPLGLGALLSFPREVAIQYQG